MVECNLGRKCPKCGAEAPQDGQHETAIREYKTPELTIGDVGWRCWKCGHEWGFAMEVRSDHARL